MSAIARTPVFLEAIFLGSLSAEAASKRDENLLPAARSETFWIFFSSAQAQGAKKRTKQERVKTCARFHTWGNRRGRFPPEMNANQVWRCSKSRETGRGPIRRFRCLASEDLRLCFE
jgi:hypothetical protein